MKLNMIVVITMWLPRTPLVNSRDIRRRTKDHRTINRQRCNNIKAGGLSKGQNLNLHQPNIRLAFPRLLNKAFKSTDKPNVKIRFVA